MSKFTITNDPISPEILEQVIQSEATLSVSDEVKQKITACRNYLDDRIRRSSDPIYGVNTGFGALYNKEIPAEGLEALQRNLVLSHACGTGDLVPDEVIRLMLLLKIQGLSHGHSGVQLSTVERLVDHYNHDILPVVYQQGSLGASGDLAPLAHLSLPLLGEGEVKFKGEIRRSSEVLRELNWKPLVLQSKEGLALLNGTQFMSAYGIHVLNRAGHLVRWADMISAISIDAYDGRIEPFNSAIHDIRPHSGQMHTASAVRQLLAGSEIITRKKAHVQDPYSLRCIPQVHGASKDAFNYIYHALTTEINSVTDNPTIFPEQDLVISAGNFHGQPIALPLDMMAIAMSELASISERRIYLLISGQRHLPPFLAEDAGVNSGFMIPQYTAASLVSQNKQYCTPSSVDSITSSNGQEDHVSMGANAATKAYRVLENCEQVLAIELLTAVQALDFRRPLRSSSVIEEVAGEFRKKVPHLSADRIMHNDMITALEFLRKYELPEISV
jgi:histidine ammonia-lyase